MFDILKHDEKFRYALLDRLRQDCIYYLGNGNRNKENLWTMDVLKQISTMKAIYNSFIDEEKPEWLTYEQILHFEKDM